MLIEHIIEFELRRAWPYVCSTTGYFHDKTKISKENFRMDYYLQLKYCWRQYRPTLLSLLGQNHLQNLTPK